MGTALYTKINSEGDFIFDCPFRHGLGAHWQDDLPPMLKDLVVAPIHFEVFDEYEMSAARTCGRDTANLPCYCEFHYVQTQLRSDDDEVFYEVPVYAESLTSWRLLDERWLICKTTVGSFDAAQSHTTLFLSNTMPR